MGRRWVAPLIVVCTLAVPASASAHARTATVALDYRLVLDASVDRIHGLEVSVLDGDRDLRVHVPDGTLVIRGDLGEPMLRIGGDGVWANRDSVTAVAEKLTGHGSGWARIASGRSFVWHEHRLSPPPYGDGTPGEVARFVIPADLNGQRVTLTGAFIRVPRPILWPWLAAVGVTAAALIALLRVRPALRRPATIVLGSVAAIAALVAFVSFTTADATTGRVAWAQIGVVAAFAAALAAALIRLRGVRRSHLAGVVGAASAAISLGSLGVFRHGVVISSLPAGAARTLCAVALTGGAAALVASITMVEKR